MPRRRTSRVVLAAVTVAILVGSVLPVPPAAPSSGLAGAFGATTLGHVVGYGTLAALGVDYVWTADRPRSPSGPSTGSAESPAARSPSAQVETAQSPATRSETVQSPTAQVETAQSPTAQVETASSTPPARTTAFRGALAVVLAVSAVGGAVEVLQAPIPWRTFSVYDMALNAAGACGGALLAGAMRFYRADE